MRIRALKPGFFKNEQLAELSAWHRLCFAGLWCCADKEGRVEDRPKRLKAEIFPYDDLDIDRLLWDLAAAGFIRRYVIGLQPLISIPRWFAHQHPRQDEAPSDLAAYIEGTDRNDGLLDVPKIEAVRRVDTAPRLISDGPVTTARMGNGRWEVGDGIVGDTAATASASLPVQELFNLWNATVKPPFPKCRELNGHRRRQIKTRLATRPDLAEWRRAFEAIQTIPFFRGENERHWIADFDFFLKNDTKVAQVLERIVTTAGGHTHVMTPEETAAAQRRMRDQAS